MFINTSSLSSFFDDSDPKFSFQFTKPKVRHQKDLQTPPSIATTLTCRDSITGETKRGLYGLYNQLLVSCTIIGSIKTFHSVLDLGACRLERSALDLTGIGDGFTVYKNERSFEFSASDKYLMDRWILKLRSVCILTDFHQEYEPVKMIGKGAFAKVFLIKAKFTDKLFAAKAMAKRPIVNSNKATSKAAILNEINIIRALDHDNIMKLYEVHETDNSIYMVMELIEGNSLQHILKARDFGKKYKDNQIIQMIRSILEALSYLASKGIMHRDLKPDNILVSKDGQVKIVDFGLATYINKSDYIFKKCGTPGYIAPEVFGYDHKSPDTAYNASCDVFSAGCIFYYMLTETPLFTGSKISEVVLQNRDFSEQKRFQLEKMEDVSQKNKKRKEMFNLMYKMLDCDPKERFQASECLEHKVFDTILLLKTTNHPQRENSQDGLAIHKDIECLSPLLMNHSITSQKSDISTISPITSETSRFVEKGSLYLDVGKPEVDGQIMTLSNGSMNSSAGFKIDTENLLSLPKSSFSKPLPSPTEHKQVIGAKRFSVTAQNSLNQHFLKAAILNNIRRSSVQNDESEVNDLECKETNEVCMQIPYQKPLMSASKGKGRLQAPDTCLQSETSIRVDSIGDEYNQAKDYCYQLEPKTLKRNSSKMIATRTAERKFFYTFTE